jgi:hypothetical protein
MPPWMRKLKGDFAGCPLAGAFSKCEQARWPMAGRIDPAEAREAAGNMVIAVGMVQPAGAGFGLTKNSRVAQTIRAADAK